VSTSPPEEAGSTCALFHVQRAQPAKREGKFISAQVLKAAVELVHLRFEKGVVFVAAGKDRFIDLSGRMEGISLKKTIGTVCGGGSSAGSCRARRP